MTELQQVEETCKEISLLRNCVHPWAKKYCDIFKKWRRHSYMHNIKQYLLLQQRLSQSLQLYPKKEKFPQPGVGKYLWQFTIVMNKEPPSKTNHLGIFVNLDFFLDRSLMMGWSEELRKPWKGCFCLCFSGNILFWAMGKK